MKKICCAILAVLCILPCLAGCGKKDKYVEYPYRMISLSPEQLPCSFMITILIWRKSP